MAGYPMRLGCVFLLLAFIRWCGAEDWTEFRGAGRAGTSSANNILTTWDSKQNVRWKTPLPGPGTSSPVLFGKRLYLTCYTGYGLSEKNRGDSKELVRHLLCIDQSSGKIVWDAPMPAKVAEPAYAGFLALHGFASSTPAVDADGVYVFCGASGLVAYDHNGKLKWEKDCGRGHAEDWGSASSPVLYKDLVIIHADVESETIFAFDRKTGREAWQRKFKPESAASQHTRATPLLLLRKEGDQLILNSRMNWVTSLDPASGKVRWEYKGTKDYQNPSPITDGSLIFVVTYLKTVALRPNGEEAWVCNDGSEICTPIYHAGNLFWANEQGQAFCVNAKTGKFVYQERFTPSSDRIYASGVLAEGKIYYVSRTKGTFVVPAAPEFRLLAHNKLDDDPSVFNATPALEDGRIYLRSDKFLYCIGSR